MKNSILQTMREIEQTNQVKIIFACVTGSRGWKLHSEASDYDVRFIYVEKIDRYLSIDPIGMGKQKDVIEWPVNGQIDLSGWELTKALRLFRKSNPSLLEWLHTSTVYTERYNTMERLRSLLPDVFSKKACIYHYLHIVYSNRKKLNANITVKQALAIIHPLLIAQSIKLWQVFPVGDFHDLTAQIGNELIRSEVEALARKKMSTEGDKAVILSETLVNWIASEVEVLEKYVKQLDEEKRDCTPELNLLFQETLQQAWQKK